MPIFEVVRLPLRSALGILALGIFVKYEIGRTYEPHNTIDVPYSNTASFCRHSCKLRFSDRSPLVLKSRAVDQKATTV